MAPIIVSIWWNAARCAGYQAVRFDNFDNFEIKHFNDPRELVRFMIRYGWSIDHVEGLR